MPFPSYFVLLLSGFLLATVIGAVWAKRVGQNPDVVVDLGLAMVLAGVAGGRILHVLADGHLTDYVNLCIDHQRREAKLPLATNEPRQGERSTERTEDALAALPDSSEQGDPYQRTRDAEIARNLHRAIADLTPEHRAVILLREVDGLSYEEISHVLEVPKGTVMSRLHYARRQLQERLRGLR